MKLKTFVSLVFYVGLLQLIKTKCILRYKYRTLNNVQIKLLIRHCSDRYNDDTKISNRVETKQIWNSPKVDLSWNIKESIKTLEIRDSEDISDTTPNDSSWNTNETDESSDTSDTEKFFDSTDKHSDSLESFETVFKRESRNSKINGYQFLSANIAINNHHYTNFRVRGIRRKPTQTCSEKPIYIYVPLESTGLIDALEWQDKGNETNGEGIFKQKLYNDDNDFSLCPEEPSDILAHNKNSDLSFCGDSIQKPSKNVTENLGKDENSNVSSLCGDEPDDKKTTPSTQVTPIKKSKKTPELKIKDLAELLPPNSLETKLFDKTNLRKLKKNVKIDAGDVFSHEALDKVLFDSNESLDNKQIEDQDDDLSFIESLDITNDSIDSTIKKPLQKDNLFDSKEYPSIETLLNTDMNEFTGKHSNINSISDVLSDNSLELFFNETIVVTGISNIIDKNKADKNKTTRENNPTKTPRSLSSNSKEILPKDSSEKTRSCDSSDRCPSADISVKITIKNSYLKPSINRTIVRNSDSHTQNVSSKSLINSTNRPLRIYKRDKFGNNIDIVSDESLSNFQSFTPFTKNKPTKKYFLSRNGDIIDPLTGNPAVILDSSPEDSSNKGERKMYMHDVNGFIIQIEPEINDKTSWHTTQSLDRKRKKIFRLDKNHNLIDIINFDESKEITKTESANYGDYEVESPKNSVRTNDNNNETTTTGLLKVSVEKSVSSESQVPIKKPKAFKDRFDNVIEVNSIENEEMSIWTSAHSLVKRTIRQYKINKNGELVDIVTGEIENFSFSGNSQSSESKYKLDRHGNIINVFLDDIEDDSNWLGNDVRDKRSKKTFKVDKYGNLIDIIDNANPHIKPELVTSNQSSNETKDENEEALGKPHKSKLFLSNIDALSIDPTRIFSRSDSHDHDQSSFPSYDLRQYPDVSKFVSKEKVDIVAKYPEMFMDTNCDKVQTVPRTIKQLEPNNDYDIYNYGNLLEFSIDKHKVPLEMFEDTVCGK